MTLIEPPPATEIVPTRGLNGQPSSTPNAQKIRELYQKGTRAIRAEQQAYVLNSSYIAGQDWVYFNQTRNQLLQLPRNPKRMQVSIPRMRPESRGLIAKLLRRELVFEVPPTAPDDATIRGARTAERVVTDLARDQNWERLREDLAWIIWKGGTGLLCLDWDPGAGQYLGQTEDQRKVGTGECCATALSVVEVATEPGVRDIERGTYWIKAMALPPGEVKRLYKLPTDPATDANTALNPLQAKLLTIGRSDSTPPATLTLVLTYYERPNSDNPRGAVATVVGDKIVDGPHPWPFPFTDRLNVVCMKETTVEGRWTGDTILSDAVPIQTALNMAWTSTLEHLKVAGNARVQTSIVNQENVEHRTDEVGEVMFYMDNTSGKYEYLVPPQMPEWWITAPERLATAMDDVLGRHDVSRGEAPRNIESGLGISILVEQDESPIGHLAKTMADGWGRFATLVLQTYEKKVTSARKAKVTYPALSSMMDWTGKDFMGQTTARVPYEAVAPLNDAARAARGIQFASMGVFNDPQTGQLDARKLAAFLDVPGQTNFIEVTDPDVARARRENYLIAAGEVAIPEQWDDHQKHILEHTNFLKSAEWESLDPQTQQTFLKHIQAHTTMAAEEAGQMALKAEAAPALAASPDASQPSTLLPGGGQQGPGGGAPGGSVGASALPPGLPSGPSGSPPPADQGQQSQDAYFAARNAGVPLTPQLPPT